MSKQSKLTMPLLYTAILYLCGLFLFIEWLYPVQDITDTESIFIFIVYAVFCFFVSMINMQWWLSFLLKTFGLIFILNGLYFEVTLLSPAWFQRLFMEVAINADLLLQQEWYYLTPLFRSFLFLLLIWLMSYLLHYWFVQMKRVFLFIILTFIYIAVLDTFTLYDATNAIIRTFIVSLVSLAMVNFSRDLEKEEVSFPWLKRASTWLVPLGVTIMFSVIIGIALPKLEPQWPDPVPFIHNASEEASTIGGGAIQKVGYGEDDSRLGGSFIQDNSPVFYADVVESHYWRIETKDVYTGKGWETSADPDYIIQNPEDIGVETFYSNVETEERTTNVYFEPDQMIDKIVYPYGLRNVNIDVGTMQIDYYLDTVSDAVQARFTEDEHFEADSYSLVYDHPSISLTALQNSTEEFTDMEQYLQVPDTLPARVGELAEEITAEDDTLYEKVRTIEGYFSSNGFSYETTGVAVPGPDEDYVDQFLFDTQIGYCDNFSTAMVVLLRTLDIPARWVKGFTGGEMVQAGDTHHVYEVTNANAHSWVEVYFPETGWVPFEPTQGFSNPTDFYTETSGSEFETPDNVPEQPEEEPAEENEPEEEETEPAMAEVSDQGFQIKWWHIGLVILIVLVIAFVLFKKRFQLKTKLYKMKLNRNQNEASFQAAYLHLLRVLAHYGYERDTDQTLRQFAKHIDSKYHTEDMQELTKYYERMLYRNDFESKEIAGLTRLWENLINKIMG